MITVSGLTSSLKYSHSINGEKFYKGDIYSRRLSGTIDVIPIVISELLTSKWHNQISINGEIRTRNVDGHLQLYVFVDSISSYQDDSNIVTLTGTVCNIPSKRFTPSGKIITNLIVATHRSYNKSDYIPCIVWGNSRILNQGDVVNIEGRLQSRKYKDDKITYEVSVSLIW